MKVNEIFYSLQGEGNFTGTPAVFIRFARCNLRCSFCDTEFASYMEMREEEIMKVVNRYPATHVVITGGEPTLQLTPTLLWQLHRTEHYVQIETNGTRNVSDLDIDYITCSPKFEYNDNAKILLEHADELKVVYTGQDMDVYNDTIKILKPSLLYLQPCDTGNEEKNKEIIQKTINYIKDNPRWKLSLQTQKILNLR